MYIARKCFMNFHTSAGTFVSRNSKPKLPCPAGSVSVAGFFVQPALRSSLVRVFLAMLLGLMAAASGLFPVAHAEATARKKAISTAELSPVPCAPVTKATIVESTRRYSINVAYPVIGASLVDKDIAHWANEQVGRFRAGVAEIPDVDPSRFTLAIDYEVFQPSLRCISYVFQVETNTGIGSPEKGLLTFTYHIQQGNRLTLADLFNSPDGLLEFFSRFSRRQLWFREWIDANTVYVTPGTAPEAVNFSAFAVTSTGITLYFPPKQVAPAIEGCVSLPVPMREMYTFAPNLSLWEGCALPKPDKALTK